MSNIDWFVKISNWYQMDLWSKVAVHDAVLKGKITPEQEAEILQN